MKNKSGFWVQMGLIFLVGLVVSFLAGDFELGGVIGGPDGLGTKALIDIVGIILAVLALILGVGYLFYRAARGKTEGSQKDDGEGGFTS